MSMLEFTRCVERCVLGVARASIRRPVFVVKVTIHQIHVTGMTKSKVNRPTYLSDDLCKESEHIEQTRINNSVKSVVAGMGNADKTSKRATTKRTIELTPRTLCKTEQFNCQFRDFLSYCVSK